MLGAEPEPKSPTLGAGGLSARLRRTYPMAAAGAGRLPRPRAPYPNPTGREDIACLLPKGFVHPRTGRG